MIKGVRCVIIMDYENRKKAMIIHKAVGVDDNQFVELSRKGPVIECKIKSRSIKSMLRTVNDFLRCSSIAERLAEKYGNMR
jgi:tRNA threonylcarbamoyladenosine modification (KEOPS) complex  Pcc1 subunit